MNEFQSATVITALLAEEAGVSDDELETITLIEFATRLVIARARKSARVEAEMASMDAESSS
jgi:hypothetical protein